MAAKHTRTRKKKRGPAAGSRRTTGTGSRTHVRTKKGDILARVATPPANLSVSRPVSESHRRSARNLLEELGGGDPRKGQDVLLDVLNASDDRRAPRLVDLLSSTDEDVVSRPFERKVLDAGLTPRDLAEILLDRQKTRGLVQAAVDLPEVLAGIIRRAKDRFERCDSCQGHGRVLSKDERRLQLPPADDAPACLPCDGVGWTLVGGETEAVELYLELVRLRKAQVVNDFSRRTTNQNLLNNPNFFIGNGGGGSEPAGGGPPSIDAIIRRADQGTISLPALPAPSGPTSVPATTASGTYQQMPEEATLAEDEP